MHFFGSYVKIPATFQKASQNMKKFPALCLAVILLFSFAACQPEGTSVIQDATTESVNHNTQAPDLETEQTLPIETQPEETIPAETRPEETTPQETEPTETQPEQTQPTEPTPTEPVPTEPVPETTHPEKPEDAPVEEDGCRHDYRFTSAKSPNCTQEGNRRYTCNLCGNVYKETLPAEGHSYSEATCTAPKTCAVCRATEGKALGHSYQQNGLCQRCGRKDPNNKEGETTFTVTLRSVKGEAIPGVTVHIYLGTSTTPLGSGVTNQKGIVAVSIPEQGSSYRVVLSNVSDRYEAMESYHFTSTTVSINLKIQPVYDPLDHSGAMYKEGDQMVEFTMTDVDGKTYTLSKLLQEKKVVVLDFWYVSCEPCKNEFPYFDTAVEKYGDDIAFLAINPYDSAEKIKDLREELGITFTLIQDKLGMTEGFSVESFPVTVIIDSNGTIRKIHRGAYASETAFLRELDNYL